MKEIFLTGNDLTLEEMVNIKLSALLLDFQNGFFLLMVGGYLS
ncbi:hypothetical protein [Clostridium estertheticum]|nr:hypothetical protein [Clostridium estertheticum]